jgi:hypothetical protein
MVCSCLNLVESSDRVHVRFSSLLVPLRCLCLRGFLTANAAGRDEGPLAAAWDAGRDAGSYHFESDVVQVSTPTATVSNAVRSSRSETLYMEGNADLDASAVELSLAPSAGAGPERSVGLRAVDGVVTQRQGAGEWAPATDLTDTVVPAGTT